MGYVLVDDPEPSAAGREDEQILRLAQQVQVPDAARRLRGMAGLLALCRRLYSQS